MTDELLHALGRHQREDLAADADLPINEGDEVEDERSRPFSDAERADILDAMEAMFAEPQASVEPEPTPEPTPEPAESEPVESEPAKVIELAPRRRSVAAIAIVLASAAAAVALIWLGVSGVGPSSNQDPQLAMVPDYEITQLRGGAASQRSDPDHAMGQGAPTITLRASDEIDWQFTPSEPVRAPVAVALLGRSADGELRFTPQLAAQTSPEGAIRVRGQLDTHLALTPGDWTLALLIAEPDQLPGSSEAADKPGAWRRVEFRVIIVAE
ncbi:hypothetical protein DB30_00703 [Enhygromyxa salina]|uniref:Uncharacterized protein n=1 Tax=Enhygromyxa salina TaxID=215803 RepID=A0A0C2A4T6_9BACT|nr:hypothetical protein [Enhygromyxa salina]KIG18418.1 hypothetical protein DB30_00703 [Enhygromyxa salina]